MASLRNRGGVFSIQVFINNRRETIGLGRIPEREARRLHDKVEQIETLRASGSAADKDREVGPWLAGLSDGLHAKLARIGLVPPRNSASIRRAPGLKAWIDKVIDLRRHDLAERTVELYEQTRDRLTKTIGEATPIDQITPAQAAEWAAGLAKEGLGEATRRMHARHAKAFFSEAVEQEIIARSPFRALESASIAADREHYVTPADAARILQKLPGVQHRLIFALARFAGLRTPSETHGLTWSAVDFAAGRMSVYATKTKRWRLVPIVAELAPFLQDAFDLAAEGAEKVVTVSRNNLRRTLENAITAAGLTPWEDLYQTLRRSRETEWLEEFPSHVVAAWLGHSVAVQQRHYAQVTEEHFSRACGAPQSAPQHGPESARTDSQAGEETSATGGEPESDSARENEPILIGAAHCEEWPRPDSNRGPSDYESPALTAELQGRIVRV
jgi:integrase